MRVKLRPFQFALKSQIVTLWQAASRFVLAVAATGSGKTVLFSDVILDEPGPSCAIAHRSELVSQISLALARNGVRHRIIGPATLTRQCTSLHMFELEANYIDPNSRVAVASVDTLVGRDPADPWFASVRLWVLDEAHHGLVNNKWGKAVAMFPNARGLGVTATPCRADGLGLGSHCGGLFERMVLAPTMREIINMGYLTDYRVIVPKSHLDLSEVTITASGDYSPAKLKKAVHDAHITGDVVKSYLQYAQGKLGITFAVDIQAATEIAAAFRTAGVPAEVVTSKTDILLRAKILRKFKNREILQLVNVDLFGEGFDLPAIEVVTFARPTESFSLFAQQFGRVLRLMIDVSLLAGWDNYTDAERRYFISISKKPSAIVIDHAGNIARHGLPDKAREWTLDGWERGNRSSEGVIPITVCVECASAYERIYSRCPHCGHTKIIADRSAPVMVDGDMGELPPEVLAVLRGEIAATDSNFVPVPQGVPDYVKSAIHKRHHERQVAQYHLRETIKWWAGWKQRDGYTDSEIYRLFYLTYGIDVMSAQTLGTKEAEELNSKLRDKLTAAQIVVDSPINMLA